MKFSIYNFRFSKLLATITFVFLFSAPVSVWAICEGPIVPCGGADNPCQFCHLFVLLNNILKYILTCLTPIIASLMLVIGGFYLMAAGPSPEKVRKAKSVITAVVIGVVIIMVSWVFLNTFLDMIGVAEWTGLRTWWQINCP